MLDLKGDASGAKVLLESVIRRASFADIGAKVEALVFLADLLASEGEIEAARRTLADLAAIDLHGIEADLVEHHLQRAATLRAELHGQ